MLKRTFLKGRMNLDDDERLLPDGEYRVAENIEVINSEGSDAGAIEKPLSNKKLTNIPFVGEVYEIGKYEDETDDNLYWLVKDDNGCYLLEWDAINESLSFVLKDTRPEETRVLKLDKDHLITGIAKIQSEDSKDDLLAWTDDGIEICCINIERAKTYGENNFEEEDIYLIKKAPLYAPEVQPIYSAEESNYIAEKFFSFGYRWVYLDGERSAISSYSNYQFNPKTFELDYNTVENLGMVNNFNACRIGFNTGEKQVKGIELIIKESNSNSLYIIAKYDKALEGFADNEIRYFIFSNNKTSDQLSENQLQRTYDNVPRRAKALDFAKNLIVLGNYVEGYDMLDNNGNEINFDFNLDLEQEDLSGQSLTVTFEDNGINITIPDDVELVQNSRLIFDIKLKNDDYNGSFEDIIEYLLPDTYSDAQELAESDEFIQFIEEVLTSVFEANFEIEVDDDAYLTPTVTAFSITNATATTINILAPQVVYTVDETPADTTDNPTNTHTETISFYFESTSEVLYNILSTFASLKTNRDYEAGPIYLDKWGRRTPVMICPNNSIYVKQEYSIYKNSLLVNINHPAPAWAVAYKIGVKHQPLSYQTIYATVFFEEGLYRWVKLEGENINKVKQDDVLIVKSDLDGYISDLIEVKVIELKEQDKNFLEDNQDENGNDIVEPSGLYMKIKPIGFNMNYNDATFLEWSEYKARKKSKPSVILEDLGFTDADENFQLYTINSGSRVELKIESWEDGSGGDYYYEKSWIVQGSYASIQEWWEAEVDTLGDFIDYVTYEFQDNGRNWFFQATEKGSATHRRKLRVTLNIYFVQGIIIFETQPNRNNLNLFYESEETFAITDGNHQSNVINQDYDSNVPAKIKLSFFNCFVQGNGGESYRVKDGFNKNWLNPDLRPTSTLIEKYRETRKFADLTYGGSYIESSGMNNINEFNNATGNWKELDKSYGSIQKIAATDSNIIVLQEQKASQVLLGKDLLTMANGESVLSKIPEILGEQIPYAGENGIGKSPESYFRIAYQHYYMNPRKSTPIRLSNDGTSEINYKTVDFFRDLFIQNPTSKKIGGYDPYHKKAFWSWELEEQKRFLLQCGNNIFKTITEAFTYELQLNNLSGDITLSYEVVSGNVTIEALFNGTTHVASNVSGTGTITFTRDSLLEDIVTVTVTPIDGEATFSIINTCPSGIPLKLISVVLNDEDDIDKTINNRFKWELSQFYSENILFEESPTLFKIEDGLEGIGKFPANGSVVNIQSYKDAISTGRLDTSKCNRLGFLITDTLYTEEQVENLLSEVTWLTITSNQTGLNTFVDYANFLFSREENEHLYLIWDFKDRSPVLINDSFSVESGETVILDVLDNDTVDENATITIATQPSNGTATVNEDGTITYTHDGSLNLSDSFVYEVSNGSCSAQATVEMLIGLSCGDSLDTSGNAGIYEVDINFGTGIGYCGIRYNAYTVPDRFQLYVDGVLVADSKFVGDGLQGDPPTYNGLIADHGELPIYQYNGSTFIDSGETQTVTVTQDDVADGVNEPIDNQGVIYFNKTTATPTTAKLVVTGVLGSTAWIVNEVICPQDTIPE